VKDFSAIVFWKFCVNLCFLFCASVGVAQNKPQNFASNAPGNKFTGSVACKGCHSEIWNNFYKNPHNKSIVSGKEAPENTGCEGCHGPGDNHIESFAAKGSIVSFTTMPKEQVLDTCLKCHSQTLSRANIRRSSHTTSGVVCTNCHSIHSAATPERLLAKTQTNLCEGCHLNVRSQFSMPFKHRVNEGFMKCTDCHNPHGTFQATWTNGARPRHVESAKANEEPCLNCHADKRGPFVFEHAPVRVDGCMACHVPHGSPNSRMLTRPVVFTLCLECHNGAGNLGRRANGVILQAPLPHNMANPTYQGCPNCHVKIHGSNAEQRFFR
jgi:DmsE family decaheme c-type cytochrome